MNTNRVLFADILRCIAILSVVTLHVISPLLYFYNQISINYWWIGNIYDGLNRWCVPIFIMISGMFLLNKNEESITIFLKKRFSKILIPLIFWSIMYYIWKIRTNIQLFSLKNVITDFLQGQAYYHLWFAYMILGLYLITPILKIYINNANKHSIRYFLYIWLLITCGYPLISKLFNINIGINIEFANGYIGYFILGYYLSIINLSKMQKKVLYFMAIICLVITPIFTFILTKKNNGILDEYVHGYLSPTTIIISTAVFLLIKNINWNNLINHNSIIYKIINLISHFSFGIYLMHVIILEFLSELNINCYLWHPVIGIPITLILIIIICIIINLMLTSLPYFKNIV